MTALGLSVSLGVIAAVWALAAFVTTREWRLLTWGGLAAAFVFCALLLFASGRLEPHPASAESDRLLEVASVALGVLLLAGVVATQMSVRAVQQMRDDLAVSRGRHESLRGNRLGMVWESGADGRFRYLSDELAFALGVQPGISGVSIQDVLHPDDHTLGARAYRELWETDDYVRFGPVRTRGSTPSGASSRWLEFMGQRYQGADGSWHVVGTARDLTEAVEQADELRARVQQQEAVANLGRRILQAESLDAVFDDAVHTVARTLDVNYCTLFELAVHSKVLSVRAGAGWQASLVGQAGVKAGSDHNVGRALAEGKRVIVADFALETDISPPPLVRYREVRSGVVVVIPTEPTPFGALAAHSLIPNRFSAEDAHFLQTVANLLAAAIARDRALAELESGRQRLFNAQKLQALGTLSGGIAHDFNNMLHAIIGNTQLALAETEPGSLSHANMQDVLKAANRARELTRQILMFGLRSRPNRELVRVYDVVREVRNLMRASLPASIEIQTESDAESDLVSADGIQLYQVFVNLCSNAGTAMTGKGGLLEMYVSTALVGPNTPWSKLTLEPGSYVRITVRDSGPGIPRDIQDRIFEPFFSWGPGDPEASERTGMGLAVVHGIVEGHNGAITVASEPGNGATFDVFLPLAKAERASVSIAERLGAPAAVCDAGTESVLFVDDEPSLVTMTERALSSLGYHVRGLTSSTDALELFRTDPDAFDLVVMDQNMPHMKGDALAKELLSIRPGLPIILCTGYSDELTPDEAKARGVRDYLVKPTTIDELAVAVRRVLDES